LDVLTGNRVRALNGTKGLQEPITSIKYIWPGQYAINGTAHLVNLNPFRIQFADWSTRQTARPVRPPRIEYYELRHALLHDQPIELDAGYQAAFHEENWPHDFAVASAPVP
jgi:hypothetical protein